MRCHQVGVNNEATTPRTKLKIYESAIISLALEHQYTVVQALFVKTADESSTKCPFFLTLHFSCSIFHCKS